MFYDIYASLCSSKGISPSKVAEEIGINKSSVTNWKKNGYTPRAEQLNKIALYFGVSVSYLLGAEQIETAPALTKKDERDIEKKLADVLSELESGQDGLMFSGEALDDTTRELLTASLRNSMQMGKALAKQKYTPKKYRKKED